MEEKYKDNKVCLIFRKSRKEFNSIENVFNTLFPFLDCIKVELPNDSIGLFPRLKNIIAILKLNVPVIHITGHDHYLLWFRYDKKTVLTIHDIESLKRKKGFKRTIFKFLWFDLPIRNADVITTISEFSRREIVSICNTRKSIQVIPNPTSLPILKTEYLFNNSCPRILHIGVKDNKNLKRTIRALKGISCKLIIIGLLPKKIEDLLIDCKTNYETKNNLTTEEMIEEYKSCDLLSFVSTYEGFGLPILEAQAAGKPILTSSVSSMPEVGGEGAIYVDPYSVDKIREGFIKLFENQKLRNDIVAKGYYNVKRFSPEEISIRYKTLYNALIVNGI